MEIFLLLAMTAAGSPPVPTTVVALGADPALHAVAQELRQGLAQDPRLTVRATVPSAAVSAPSDDRLEGSRVRIAEARAAYESLAPTETLQKLGEAKLVLACMLEDPEARVLLARALRLQGLTHLYQEDGASAARAFVTASFLQPDWSPAEEEWPPEARLAHADALASARRSTPGVLSVRLQPELSVLWLDGRRVGVGPTTISDLAPGEHLLMAAAPGHATVAAVVEVSTGARLSEASLYLEPTAEAASVGERVGLATLAFGEPHERSGLAELARSLESDNIVAVTADPVVANGGRVAWVVRPDGSRDGPFIALAPTGAAVGTIADRLVGVTRVAEVSSPLAAPEPWYMSYWAWGAAGGVVLAAGGVAIWALTRDDTNRVSLFIGRGSVAP